MKEENQRVVEIRKGENESNVRPVVVAPVSKKKKYSQTVKSIRQVCIWFNIFTAMVCALISLVNIWLDNNLGELMGKAWATFLVLGAFSLFIMIIAPLLDKDEA